MLNTEFTECGAQRARRRQAGLQASGWMETYMGPAPRVPTRNQVKRPARLMVRNLRCSPGATSRSSVFQFQVLSTRRRWRPGVTGMVTVPPYMSSATGLPSSFTMIWRSWISSGEVRQMVICASGTCAEAEDMAGAQHTAKIGFASYFLKRSSKAWRASLWRGGGGVAVVVPFCA
jgi:hypothetical protein